MASRIDGYRSLLSPFSYLGHQRCLDLAVAAAVMINLLPVDIHIVCPATGGLPVVKRAPRR